MAKEPAVRGHVTPTKGTGRVLEGRVHQSMGIIYTGQHKALFGSFRPPHEILVCWGPRWFPYLMETTTKQHVYAGSWRLHWMHVGEWTSCHCRIVRTNFDTTTNGQISGLFGGTVPRSLHSEQRNKFLMTVETYL